jgi:putative phosphoesterase
MKIGVISDTHLSSSDADLKKLLETLFSDADLILHAGDIVETEVLEAFSGKELIAVHGNMDSSRIKQSLPQSRLLTLEGFKIGLVHGWGAPMGIEKRVRSVFDEVDAIVFGHSHKPCNRVIDGVLFFNPGAYGGGFFRPGAGSVGILTLGDTITGAHYRVG